MPDKEKDYFEKTNAMPLGKRRLSRLNTKRVLQKISNKRTGWEQGWTTGKVSFMKTYPVKTFPRSFAKVSDDVFIQVSIRLVLGKTAKDAPILGLKGLDVYYRYLKRIVVRPEKEEREDVEEADRDEKIEFSEGRNITEYTEWVGSHLSNSQMARQFYQLIKAIGKSKLERIISRTRKRKKK